MRVQLCTHITQTSKAQRNNGIVQLKDLKSLPAQIGLEILTLLAQIGLEILTLLAQCVVFCDQVSKRAFAVQVNNVLKVLIHVLKTLAQCVVCCHQLSKHARAVMDNNVFKFLAQCGVFCDHVLKHARAVVVNNCGQRRRSNSIHGKHTDNTTFVITRAQQCHVCNARNKTQLCTAQLGAVQSFFALRRNFSGMRAQPRTAQ